MITAISVLVTDVGTFPCPPDLDCGGLKLRRDRQPDKRTAAGKAWHRKFRAFSDQKLKEYLS